MRVIHPTGGPGQMLFEFARHWSRRSNTPARRSTERGKYVLVTKAIASLAKRGPATINAVASAGDRRRPTSVPICAGLFEARIPPDLRWADQCHRGLQRRLEHLIRLLGVR